MLKAKSILEINNDEIFEKVQYEHDKIMANILDPNTDEKDRELTIKLKYKPNRGNKTITIIPDVSAKLGKLKPIQTPLLITKIHDDLTGEVKDVLKQFTGQADGQIDIFGRITEPEIIVYGTQIEIEKKEEE